VGVTKIIVHSRVCVLSGLSTAENRTVPALRYGVVRRLVTDFPDIDFVVNGGIRTLSEAEGFLGVGGRGDVWDCSQPTDGDLKYGGDGDWEVAGTGEKEERVNRLAEDGARSVCMFRVYRVRVPCVARKRRRP